MVNSYAENLKTATELSKEPEEKEYVLFSELSENQKLKMELVESIRHTSDRQTKTKLIEEAAKKLEKSTRTIRRMVAKVEQEGLAAKETK
jgi:putative transposase